MKSQEKSDCLKELREKIERKKLRCPICGCEEAVLLWEDEFPLIKPAKEEDGGYSYIPGINYGVLHTAPVKCKECGFIMFFGLDKQ